MFLKIFFVFYTVFGTNIFSYEKPKPRLNEVVAQDEGSVAIGYIIENGEKIAKVDNFDGEPKMAYEGIQLVVSDKCFTLRDNIWQQDANGCKT